MKAYAELMDRLSFMASRNGKLALIVDYLNDAPESERGWAVAVLMGRVTLPEAKPNLIRQLMLNRMDETLFALSYDYVGDLAETVALLWEPGEEAHFAMPTLEEVIHLLRTTPKADLPAMLTRWLDSAPDATTRWALLKLVTGNLRIGVSARMVFMALEKYAQRHGIETAADTIEEVFHNTEPPFAHAMHWLEGRAEAVTYNISQRFRPFMLANPLEEASLPSMNPADYAAEWKWDGIRVQLVSVEGRARLYSRTGDEITGSFPDLVTLPLPDVVLDGELLVKRDGEAAPFNDLQQRLNRKVVTKAMMDKYPVGLRAYDLLVDGEEDLRSLPFRERRAQLERWYEKKMRPVSELKERIDISELVPFENWEELAALREQHGRAEEGHGMEGLMLKRWDASYIPGRKEGYWYKWKRQPLTFDTVLLYAQRGHGKRSSYYSDYTFGVWSGDGESRQLVPVGKAYSGFTDAELLKLDRWIRNHTITTFGPVRQVSAGLVLEVECDSLQASTRHKSGVAMRFPRVSRIRWDKPIDEADTIENLTRWISVKAAP